MRTRKLYIIFVVIFVFVLIGCTIYSRTVYQWNLPKVTVAMSRAGIIQYSHVKQGVVELPDGGKGLEEYDFCVTVTLPRSELSGSIFFMYEGDKVPLSFPAVRRAVAEGMVTSIFHAENEIILTVGFDSDVVAVGDNVDATVGKEAYVDCIFPRSALFIDSNGGEYVFVLKERRGPWGTEYYLERFNLLIWADTGDEVSANRYEPIEYPIAIGCDKYMYDGMIVRIF